MALKTPPESDRKQALFDFWSRSRSYRDYGRSAGLRESEFRRSLAGDLAGCRTVLDLACGDGNNLPHLPEGIDYLGCDCSPLALERLMARDDHPPLNKATHACDIARLPVGDATQDAVISSYSFEHFLELPRVLDECDRVLKPGGLLILFGPDFSFPNNYGPPQHGREGRNRLSRYAYAARRLLRRLRYGLGPRRVLFEYVEPLPLADETFIPDHDLTHLTDHAMIARYLAASGYTVERLDRIRSRPPGSGPAPFGRLRLWGPSGDGRAILRKPRQTPPRRPLVVTERLISRQGDAAR